ncbi:hypothetical protein [Actinomadura sp. NPDC049753]|uniref:hypothetical protein n=1 Tax=Actinomadura sp. NPDC049753 TaxID=3154739 RepID=UPI003448B340
MLTLALPHQTFHGQVAELLRRDLDTGLLVESVEPLTAGVELVALAGGLAYYPLIGIRTPETARDRVGFAVAGLYGDGERAPCTGAGVRVSPGRPRRAWG